MKSILILLAVIFPGLAMAENENVQCTSDSEEIAVVDVAYWFNGTYSEMMDSQDVPVNAVVVINWRKEVGPPRILDMTGVGNYSAKGPYFELVSAEPEATLFISAVASGSPSEFVYKGKKYDLNCN